MTLINNETRTTLLICTAIAPELLTKEGRYLLVIKLTGESDCGHLKDLSYRHEFFFSFFFFC